MRSWTPASLAVLVASDANMFSNHVLRVLLWLMSSYLFLLRCSWAAYVAGTLLVLMHECGAQLGGDSLAVLVASDVPPGSGVSSSAALEVAAMTAFAAALRIDVPPKQLALLCQQVRSDSLICLRR